MPYWNDSAAAGSVLEHAAQIATASPFWYSISTAGAVSAEPGAGPASVVAALRARGVEVVPTVTEAAGLDAFDRMLANGERRAALVRSLVALAREDGYAGIDLDFEQFAVDPQDDTVAAAAATRAFSGFVAALCAALHAVDRSCTVTVMPRTSAAQTLWRRRLATWVFDYRALGRVADTVRIMAYDEHGRHGPAGPVAPLPWVEQVIAYARSQIPAAKVELGLAAFGWLWGPHGVEAFSAAQGPAVAAAAGTTATWSASADEMSFTAGTGAGRVVGWYEDTRADAIRAKLAAAAGFRGVALWAAGDETPDFWAAMRAVPGS
jgi:spore germination protein YaaH